MNRPTLLDLFCSAGGASVGYFRAGFDVTGVDNVPQKNYPFPFILADAMTVDLSGYDAIAASPPCQKYSPLNARCGYTHTIDLVDPIRQRLLRTGVPWVIENVMGAPLVRSIRLCGGAGGYRRLSTRHYRLSL